MLSKVDLPQPEWPMIETYSPGSILRFTSRSTSVVTPPRENEMPTWSIWR